MILFILILNKTFMFISRKTFRMRSNKNKVFNSQVEIGSANPITVSQNRMKNDVEIIRYPVFFYFIGIMMVVIFAYLMYSANGGAAGIPGLRQKLWWQFILALLPLVLAILIFVFSKIESVCIYGEKLEFSRTIMLGFKNYELIERQISDLLNILIVKKGYEMVTFTNSSYFLVFNFKAYDQIETLECSSEITAVDYLSQLNSGLPHLRGSNKKITIKSIVNI